ncbi:MAG: ribosome maturation factor RimM [Candidatus Methylomirabilaceae bacterium]
MIEKPFGVKGEVRVRSLSDVPGRFEGLKDVTLVAPSGRSLVTVVNRVREHSGSYLLGFDAFSTPEEAAEFRGAFVKISRGAAPPLPAGQYYEFELVGMTVVTETGRLLGTLEEVLETGSNHVFVVRREGREILIPGLRQVVTSVDLQRRTMTVRLIPGMGEDEHANADAV